jgi:hypothetical protein
MEDLRKARKKSQTCSSCPSIFSNMLIAIYRYYMSISKIQVLRSTQRRNTLFQIAARSNTVVLVKRTPLANTELIYHLNAPRSTPATSQSIFSVHSGSHINRHHPTPSHSQARVHKPVPADLSVQAFGTSAKQQGKLQPSVLRQTRLRSRNGNPAYKRGS